MTGKKKTKKEKAINQNSYKETKKQKHTLFIFSIIFRKRENKIKKKKII